MQKKKTLYIFMVLTLFIVTFISSTAYAKDEKGQGLGFNVSPMFNSNQIDPNSSLFYIKTTPNESQTIEVKVKSTQKEKVNIKVSFLDAYTTHLNTIGYAIPKDIKNVDSSLKEPLSSLISSDTMEFSVKNFEEKTIRFKVNSPKEDYEGIKLGSIMFKSSQEEKSAAMTMTGSTEIGVILSNNGEEFNDGKTLKMKKPKAQLLRGKRMVTANLQNPEPKTLENLKINAVIVEKKSGKKIKEKEIKGAAMAPNSNFDFEIDWGLAQLPTGEFTYKMVVSNDFEIWKFEKDFIITGKQASDINGNSGYKIITPTWIKIVSLIQVVLMFILIIWLVLRRKKLTKAFKERKKKNRNKKRNKRGA